MSTCKSNGKAAGRANNAILLLAGLAPILQTYVAKGVTAGIKHGYLSSQLERSCAELLKVEIYIKVLTAVDRAGDGFVCLRIF